MPLRDLYDLDKFHVYSDMGGDGGDYCLFDYEELKKALLHDEIEKERELQQNNQINRNLIPA